MCKQEYFNERKPTNVAETAEQSPKAPSGSATRSRAGWLQADSKKKVRDMFMQHTCTTAHICNCYLCTIKPKKSTKKTRPTPVAVDAQAGCGSASCYESACDEQSSRSISPLGRTCTTPTAVPLDLETEQGNSSLCFTEDTLLNQSNLSTGDEGEVESEIEFSPRDTGSSFSVNSSSVAGEGSFSDKSCFGNYTSAQSALQAENVEATWSRGKASLQSECCRYLPRVIGAVALLLFIGLLGAFLLVHPGVQDTLRSVGFDGRYADHTSEPGKVFDSRNPHTRAGHDIRGDMTRAIVAPLSSFLAELSSALRPHVLAPVLAAAPCLGAAKVDFHEESLRWRSGMEDAESYGETDMSRAEKIAVGMGAGAGAPAAERDVGQLDAQQGTADPRSAASAARSHKGRFPRIPAAATLVRETARGSSAALGSQWLLYLWRQVSPNAEYFIDEEEEMHRAGMQKHAMDTAAIMPPSVAVNIIFVMEREPALTQLRRFLRRIRKEVWLPFKEGVEVENHVYL